jgi:hypothetical protein
MALTITIAGTGIIANCDATASTDSAGGAWAEIGGTSLVYDPASFIYGVRSMGIKAASKSGWTYINKTTALDFDVAGAQEGELLYIWLNAAAPAAFLDLASNGFSIRLGSTTTIYREWTIGGGGGGDEMNGWSGGWKCFVLDPISAGSNDNGVYDPGNVDLIGVWVDTDVSVRAETIFIDQIACGNGLRITGTWDDVTYDGAWDEVYAYCSDYTNRAWGMVQQREGIFYVYGKIYIGDSTQSAATSFEDAGKIIQFGTSQYYNGAAWVSTMPTDACGIIIEDASTFPTEFIDGIIVGTEKGRSGSTYIGNEDQAIVMDLFGGDEATSTTLMYGTTFKDLRGTFNSGDNIGHKFLSCVFSKCSQFDPVGAPVIRDCSFAETTDIDAALLWNESIDIEGCAFISNTLGAAIEMPDHESSPYTYTSLLFSDNTDDVYNSSGNAIEITSAGTPKSDPSSSEGSSVSFPTSVQLTMTVYDEAANPIETAYAYIDDDNLTPFILNTTTNVNGVATVSHTGGTALGATWRVRKYGFRPYKQVIDVEGDDISIPVTLITDPQQT